MNSRAMNKKDLINLIEPRYDKTRVLELEHAIDFATKAHEGQKRKSGEPYIIHPLAVAGILAEWDMDIDTVIAGILHDTVEDTDTSLEQIESLFGRDVAFLVDGVTKVGEARSGMRNLDLGGLNVDYGKANRLGSHFVEVTIVGSSGRLMR